MSAILCTGMRTASDGASASPQLAILRNYFREVKSTDQLPPTEIHPVLMGLFGEVGGILATLKKYIREQASYPEYEDAVVEEFGDALWYFAALCRRLEVQDSVVSYTPDQLGQTVVRPLNYPDNRDRKFRPTLLNLGTATAALLGISAPNTCARALLRKFWGCYLAALQATGIDLNVVASRNLHKARGRFIEPEPSRLPTFDENFPPDERLPRRFEIEIHQRPSGETYLQWNGVFIGDPLTDNIATDDGYRYHDVFHLAHAAVLHWSPTFRSLIKRKRKTNPKIDEAQDGGRSIVVEEGLTAWIFSRAKQLNYFEQQSSLSFDLLKTVQQFVRGYEVDVCPLKLWEKAILKGYSVFRQVRSNGGGVIVGDRSDRTIYYKPL